MGCCSWVQLWPKLFYHCNCAICTVVSYMTGIYLEITLMRMFDDIINQNKPRGIVKILHMCVWICLRRVIKNSVDLYNFGIMLILLHTKHILKPLVKSYIHQLVQTKWDAAVHGRDVYLVKPTLGPPKKFQHLTRAEEDVITRLRIGHTKVT